MGYDLNTYFIKHPHGASPRRLYGQGGLDWQYRIDFERQKPLVVGYKGEVVGKFVADLVVEGRLLVELKALSKLTGEHEAQVINYLRAAGLGVGLLMNFGTPRLGIRRIVWRHDDKYSI